MISRVFVLLSWPDRSHSHDNHTVTSLLGLLSQSRAIGIQARIEFLNSALCSSVLHVVGKANDRAECQPSLTSHLPSTLPSSLPKPGSI